MISPPPIEIIGGGLAGLSLGLALRRAGVPFSLHVYETGPHGLGMGRPGRPAPPWQDQLLYWFKERKFVP